MKKILLTICLTLICQLSFADTCPSIHAIKHNQLQGWTAYDSEDETPLAPERLVKFKHYVAQFSLAEWVNDKAHRGAVHCYYRDNEGSDLEAYLSKDNFAPKVASKHWYEVSGAHHCAAGLNDCEFDTKPQEPQLANR